MTQPTDEAAVEPSDVAAQLRGRARYLYDKGRVKSPVLMTHAATVIETLRAQLTAANKHAESSWAALQTTAEAAASSATKAEQAERMLAEREEALVQAETDLKWIVAMTTGRASPPKRCTLINWKAQMALITIRSAASGEQG